jgi:DNA-binding CsgD family transcriptional regulator/PAS domain-containing protein
MHDDQRLYDLIGEIYDTALDPGLWANVVASIRDFADGRSCALVSKNPASGLGTIHYQAGLDPHNIRLYAETYSRFDPLRTLPPIGRVVAIPDLVSYDDYRRGRFFQEWLKPQQRADSAVVVLEKGATDAAFLSVGPLEANAMVSDDMRRRMRLIAPHARRAFLIAQAAEIKKAERAALAEVLNSLSAAMFLVDRDGRIVHANAAAHNMLYANDFLRSAGGRLAARDHQADRILRDEFSRAGGGGAGAGGKAIALPLAAHDGERYVAHVLPLTSGARRTIGTAHSAAAAVFVRKVALGHAHDVIAQAYKLTPMELRVLRAIIDIGGVPETSAALGVAETTVKTHLYHLFGKTGASRQADLVKLAAEFSSPIAE